MSKKEILEAAASIISEKGYHAASMQDIASAVRLQKASLYHHFSGKQEILLEILDAGLDMLILEMEQVIKNPLPSEEKIRLAMVTYLQAMIKYQDLSAVLMLEYRSLDPAMRKLHISRRDYFESLWRKLIDEGIQAGAFTCSDSSIASKALLGVLNWTITWYQKDGKNSPNDVGNELASLLLDGLLIRK